METTHYIEKADSTYPKRTSVSNLQQANCLDKAQTCALMGMRGHNGARQQTMRRVFGLPPLPRIGRAWNNREAGDSYAECIGGFVMLWIVPCLGRRGDNISGTPFQATLHRAERNAPLCAAWPFLLT